MKTVRIAWTVRSVMILALAGVPVVAAAAASDQPVSGVAAKGAPSATESEVALAPSTPTFGTTYITLEGADFKPFYTGEWNHDGTGSGAWSISAASFLTAQVHLPHGVTVSEIEYYVVDDSTDNASLSCYRAQPGTNAPLLALATAYTSVQSPDVGTYVMSFTPYVVDATTQRLLLGINTGATDGTIAITGARVGYRGAPGQLILFPAPDRFVDTRDGRGGKNTKYVNGESFDHTITGVAGLDGNIIPAGAHGILGNVVAITPTQNGLFKILPGGTATTLGRASVNFNGGFNTGNAFTVRLDALGRIRGFHNSPGGTTDLVVDVVGYYR